MKKIVFFCLFLLSIAVFAAPLPQTTVAEIAGYTINFSARLYNASTGQYVEAQGFNPATSIFSADYSDFSENSTITFFGQETLIGEPESSAQKTFFYKWQSATGEVVSTSSSLTLNKTANSFDDLLISIGEIRYKLTITDESGNAMEKAISVKISDNLLSCNLRTFDPIIPAEIKSSSDPIQFSAKLPIVNGTSINWYLKTPNSTNYTLTKSNAEQFEFEPATIVNNQNGFGSYQIMAIAYNKNTKKYYYSKTYSLNTVEKATNINHSEYKIVSKVIDNTKAKVEAFKYTIENADNLNVKNIFWYLNDVKVGSGESFIYEPTTTDAYKIVAKYQKTDDSIIVLNTHRETPNATGILELILIILASVVVLSAIFTASIIITNKKRDVVW